MGAEPAHGPGTWTVGPGGVEAETENRRRAGARARAVVRRLVLNAGHDHLGTLTFPVAIHDYDQAGELVAGFMHRVGWRVLGRDYVLVPELHPGGHGWHWHFTVRGRRDAVRLRIVWTEYLRSQGIVAPTSTYARVHIRYIPGPKAASYLGKYIAKTFEEALVAKGKHRYRVGQDTPRPVEEPVLVATVEASDLTGVEALAQDLAGEGALGWTLIPTSGGLVVRIAWAPPSLRVPLVTQVRGVDGVWRREQVA